DWRITFADTGLDTTIGERLRRVRHLLAGEEIFLANYGDTLTDAPLDRLVERFRADSATAALLSVRPSYSFHVVSTDPDGRVTALRDVEAADLRINGGSYLFRHGIFDRLASGEDLVDAPLASLAAEGALAAYRYDGFWVSLDTLKDLEILERLQDQDAAPWAVWRPSRSDDAPAPVS
ncbi:MAG: hypothetical protein P4L84_04790, partial [Isosphaeraceae bacterium]|nr:hypothetical protein [Isosphaeraceae bacterium]